MTKNILIGIIGIACFGSLFLYQFIFSEEIEDIINPNDDSKDKPKSSVKNITLIVDYNGVNPTKTESDFSLNNYETTVFDAVDKWCDVTYDEYPNGDYYITHIDSVGVGWIYRINGGADLPDDAVNKYYLSDFDTVEFEYVGT